MLARGQTIDVAPPIDMDKEKMKRQLRMVDDVMIIVEITNIT